MTPRQELNLFHSIYSKMLGAFVEWKVVAIAFVVGIMFAWASGADKIPVIVHPTPDNAGKVEYVDRAGVCHTFVPRSTDCGTHPPPKDIPAQF